MTNFMSMEQKDKVNCISILKMFSFFFFLKDMYFLGCKCFI